MLLCCFNNKNKMKVVFSFIVCEQKLRNREVDAIPMATLLVIRSNSKGPADPITLHCLQQFVV